MKALATIGFLLLSIQVMFGQTAPITSLNDCAPVTRRVVETTFTVEQQMDLSDNLVKLAKINFLLSASYKFIDGQVVLKSQRVMFNAKKYDEYRLKDKRVTIFDEVTGLYVELFSWNEIDKQFIVIEQQYLSSASN